ncbi:hypothetical protein B0H14DRAFT_2604556 [Mycena olivaceomarginata]|nr:hypothetical protein B0H14DRAFT_2604556 [Mycena olivaceomarginata]
MSNLPALQSLVLDDVQWADIPQHPLSFPSLDLRTLSLDFGMRAPIVAIMLPIRTRSLTLGTLEPWFFPHSVAAKSSHISPPLGWPPTSFEPPVRFRRAHTSWKAERVSTMDFHHNVGLQHLEIGEAVRLNVVGESSEVDVSPFLERLLTRVAPHCRLQTLTLGVQTVNATARTSFLQFTQLLDTPQFSALREIQFIVHGSPFVLRASTRAARECFELLLPAILPCACYPPSVKPVHGMLLPDQALYLPSLSAEIIEQNEWDAEAGVRCSVTTARLEKAMHYQHTYSVDSI